MVARPEDFLPPIAEVVEFPVDVLAMRLLAYLAAAEAEDAQHYVDRDLVTLGGFWPIGTPHTPAFVRAITEAWDWLVAQGLLSGPARQHRTDAFVTRRGQRLLREPNGLARLGAEQRLGVALHQRIADRVRTQFLLGDYELAALAALREVEIRVRELSGASESLVGHKLIVGAFREGGALFDPDLDGGESQAMMSLFDGAIGLFKNPPSHRTVTYADPTEASEVVLLADLLLRMLDRAEARLTALRP
jgi:uncharacterized protein (TIGR02391 family)